ncbi:hypothetical protein [Cupriavidus sp. UME77]|uniref:hypothetical protein n=1 Tax=Cupriavidus sp. UME77 TaxID=1862321 RepID=UPI0015FF4F0F|nr:hypothetical protein [Cupriavidus sp. UME77]MBB1630301.1 hypothetical protein [Cupriavidus sp. UME77]
MAQPRKTLRRPSSNTLKEAPPAWTLETLATTSHLRTEKLAVYTNVFSQYWTWKLESLKHVIILNGFGMTVAATLAGASMMQGKQVVIGGWIWLFTVGLYVATLGVFMGSQTLRRYRNDQIQAIASNDNLHPEMLDTKESSWFKWLASTSLACFMFGSGWLVQSLR